MSAHGSMPAPPDRRPYRRMSESGTEETAYQVDKTGRVTRLVYRQIGWLGQSGAFYAIGGGADPMQHEPGSFAPIWAIAHADDTIPDELFTAFDRDGAAGKIRDLREIQGRDGTWNVSGYMRGMYNGLELALSIVEGERKPEFRDAPSRQS